jgi:hypothetical protein
MSQSPPRKGKRTFDTFSEDERSNDYDRYTPISQPTHAPLLEPPSPLNARESLQNLIIHRQGRNVIKLDAEFTEHLEIVMDVMAKMSLSEEKRNELQLPSNPLDKMRELAIAFQADLNTQEQNRAIADAFENIKLRFEPVAVQINEIRLSELRAQNLDARKRKDAARWRLEAGRLQLEANQVPARCRRHRRPQSNCLECQAPRCRLHTLPRVDCGQCKKM